MSHNESIDDNLRGQLTNKIKLGFDPPLRLLLLKFHSQIILFVTKRVGITALVVGTSFLSVKFHSMSWGSSATAFSCSSFYFSFIAFTCASSAATFSSAA